jgi:hypothetical protein
VGLSPFGPAPLPGPIIARTPQASVSTSGMGRCANCGPISSRFVPPVRLRPTSPHGRHSIKQQPCPGALPAPEHAPKAPAPLRLPRAVQASAPQGDRAAPKRRCDQVKIHDRRRSHQDSCLTQCLPPPSFLRDHHSLALHVADFLTVRERVTVLLTHRWGGADDMMLRR